MPTLADATAKHASNLKEQSDDDIPEDPFEPGGHYYIPPGDDDIAGTDIGDTAIKNTTVLSIENNRCVFVVSVGANDNSIRLIPDVQLSTIWQMYRRVKFKTYCINFANKALV